ncbi:MAG: hypothetical protein AAGA30_03870, partial [Planctomycetota bacterium]
DTLHQLGIHQIGPLRKLPRKDLSTRFGNEILLRIDQMTGTASEPIVVKRPTAEFFAEQLLDFPTSHQETIVVILKRLIEDICQQLSARQQGALQWTIRLYHQSKVPLKLNVSLFQPTATVDHVLQLAKMQLEQALQNPHAQRKTKKPSRFYLAGQTLEVNEITISVSACVLLAHRQRQLFDENPRLDRQSLAHLINRLSGRLGRQNVVYPSIVSGAQPEFAFQWQPLVNPYSRGPRRTTKLAKAVQQQSHALARPFTLFRPAIQLDTEPTEKNNSPPALLIYADQEHPIIRQWGPERIETGWWRGTTVRRDYWRVETKTHQQFWIYFDLRKRAWFLHGEF